MTDEKKAELLREYKIKNLQGRLKQVFNCIARSREGGRTDEQIENECFLTHQSASARRRELVLMGLVRPVTRLDNGACIRRLNNTGHTAKVWRVVACE